MAGKRSAATELNHDNWDEENEPEEAGTFTKASTDVLEKRVIKTGRRRLPSRDGANMKSAFGTFTGFKTSNSVMKSSPFSFLANVITPSSTTTSIAPTTIVNTNNKSVESGSASKAENASKTDNDNAKAQTLSGTSASKKGLSEQGNEKTKSHSSEYYAKLKGLNESVTTWIKTHVDANPFCILTPIFKDYEKYLKEIKEESAKVQASHTAEQTTQATPDRKNDSKKDASVEKKSEGSSFASSKALTSCIDTRPLIAAEWKPEKQMFPNLTTSAKSIFGNTEPKTEAPKSVFGNADVTPDKGRSIFGNIESNVARKSVFGNTTPDKNPFLRKPTVPDGVKTEEEETKPDVKPVAPTFPASTFSFGQSSTTSNATAGFSFGSAKPFSFAPQAVKPQDSEDKADNEKDEEDEEPPKPDFKPITEEGAIYEQRCKVFVKKDASFSDRGVGTLYLKPTPNGKMQLIVRADTALGNLLLNTLLTPSIPTKRMNKNSIMLVCLPMPDSTPPPIPVLLRVKTSQGADDLFETLNEHKK
ncbi:hypothetical protein DMN91_003646 [Ooceraea biroi]|uniref:Nuclear pore complex protein Nup50 n=1 Tax=Ooceraea biroi TaxID=2015173 RepID=A0A026X3N7_OOCBI|nr:nuclear pore complex protein Nup50 [Ooceraea biroi]XP_011339828.1 nuclear pore complex protein Nup50 [Ooceraea biroi]EZA62009.1 Nuclear pore complex protein Nup50 [Ooceraea biroi]RLU23442.1 hypothetical protein DMN91_003646 [Ooceraea biroi]